MKFEKIKCGVVTVLVDVGGTAPLSLTGTIIAELPRHHDDTIVFPKKIEVVGNVGVEGEITTETELLILRVTAATLPTGFPLTTAQLLTDVAVNMDAIILILPVTVV